MLPKKRLGEISIDAGVLDEHQLKSALAEQRRWGGRLGRTLVEMGFVDESSFVLALSRQLGIPAVDLDRHVVSEDVRPWLKVELAEKYGVFPIARDRKTKTLHLATMDPTNYEAEKELSFHSGMRIQQSLAGPKAIERAIRKYYRDNADPGPEAATDRLPSAAARIAVGPRFRAEEPTFHSDALATGVKTQGVAPGLMPVTIDILDRLLPLEKQMTTQQKALRALLELLEEKGHLRKNEVAARLKNR